MKKMEFREIAITYCDYCGEEIKGNYHSLKYKGSDVVLDFCYNLKPNEETNCIQKHEYEKQFKPN